MIGFLSSTAEAIEEVLRVLRPLALFPYLTLGLCLLSVQSTCPISPGDVERRVFYRTDDI